MRILLSMSARDNHLKEISIQDKSGEDAPGDAQHSQSRNLKKSCHKSLLIFI